MIDSTVAVSNLDTAYYCGMDMPILPGAFMIRVNNGFIEQAVTSGEDSFWVKTFAVTGTVDSKKTRYIVQKDAFAHEPGPKHPLAVAGSGVHYSDMYFSGDFDYITTDYDGVIRGWFGCNPTYQDQEGVWHGGEYNVLLGKLSKVYNAHLSKFDVKNGKWIVENIELGQIWLLETEYHIANI